MDSSRQSDTQASITTTCDASSSPTVVVHKAPPTLPPDIEDLHRDAVLQGLSTYKDPPTGFSVFTELAHMQRGVCCGNKCRHCPFGWQNVQRLPTSVARPTALVRSGDRVGIQQKIRQLALEGEGYVGKYQHPSAATDSDEETDEETTAPPVSVSSASTSTTATTTPTTTLVEICTHHHDTPTMTTTSVPKETSRSRNSGRGRLTKKHVPYTRRGDKGTTQLATGERRVKDDDALEAMGTVDELCSVIGVVHAEIRRELLSDALHNPAVRVVSDNLQEWLMDIMARLFDIGSHIARPRRLPDEDDDDEEDSPPFVADGIGGGFDEQHTQELEDWIDIMTDELPELRNFILPTGQNASVAYCHLARTVCRRAERRVVPLVRQGVCDPRAMRYVNRLSDFLFTAARYVNHVVSLVETADNNENNNTGEEMGSAGEIRYTKPHKGATQRLLSTGVNSKSTENNNNNNSS